MALFHCHATFDTEETKEVNVQVGRRLDDGTFTALQAEGFAAVGASLDGKYRRSRASVIDHLVHRLAVGIDFVGFVDGNADVTGFGREAINADKAQGACRGLQTGPGARDVGLGCEQGQRKFRVAQGQALGLFVECAVLKVAAVDTDKGAHAFAAHRQGIYCHLFGCVGAHRLQSHGLA